MLFHFINLFLQSFFSHKLFPGSLEFRYFKDFSNIYFFIRSLCTGFNQRSEKPWWRKYLNLSFRPSFHCMKSVHIRSFSGLYFPTFGLNTEGYGASLRFLSECEKIRTKKLRMQTLFTSVYFVFSTELQIGSWKALKYESESISEIMLHFSRKVCLCLECSWNSIKYFYTKSKTELDNHHQERYIRIASQVVEWGKN